MMEYPSQHFVLLSAFVVLASAAGASFIFVLQARKLNTVSYLTELLGREYGFVRKSYDLTYEIRADGSAHVQTLESIAAINAPLAGIEHYSNVPTDPNNLFGHFSLEVKKPGGADRMVPEISITPRLVMQTPQRFYYQLLYNPPLEAGRSLVYEFQVDSPHKMFALTREELAARNLTFDFVSMKIAYPTRQLKMRITFPETFELENLGYDVWMGDARLRLDKEYGRLGRVRALKREPDPSRIVALFVVDYPIVGLKYAVTWLPTAK